MKRVSPPLPNHPATHRQRGLIAMGVAVIILVISITIVSLNGMQKKENVIGEQKSVQHKLAVIQDAIEQFRRENGRFPCPAGYNKRRNELIPQRIPTGVRIVPAFGREMFDWNYALTLDAEQCVFYQAADGYYATLGTVFRRSPDVLVDYEQDGVLDDPEVLVMGTVPVRTLNLPDDYMLDQYANRLTYVVSATNSLDTVLNVLGSLGGIEVLNEMGDVLVANGNYVIFSHGPDGKGAFTADGNMVPDSCWQITPRKDVPDTYNCSIFGEGTFVDTKDDGWDKHSYDRLGYQKER
jgi:type II secretory pathway pseudopilin PulG